MESYRVTGIPNNGEQRGHAQLARASRPSSNGAGTYGLSIRVQGIGGHPYVVLNNQDKGSQSYVDPNSNGYIDADGSFIENYEEYDFGGGKEAGSNSPFMEYRSQSTTYYGAPQNGVSESQGRKSSTLLNFQKHPELLQPYDPETNSLNIDGFHSLPPAGAGNQQQSSSSKSAVTSPSRTKSRSLDHNKNNEPQEKRPPQSDAALPKRKSTPEPLPPSQPAQPPSRTHLQMAEPQSKPSLINPQPRPGSKAQQRPVTPATAAVCPTSEQRKTSCRSPSSMSSTNSSLERARREPDVLPLRRTDSSGPVLQTSSRSRHSSSSSTTKSPLDGQTDTLYADTINRHENRRYIPFVPGSGRDIDTGSIPGVDELIEKFDSSHQRRGRAGRRNRINPEDRKRSHSVDSGLGLRDGSGFLGGFNRQRGTSVEHVLRPSQLQLQKTAGSQDSWLTVVDGKPRSRPSSRTTSAPGSPQNTTSKATGSIQPSSEPAKSKGSGGSGSSAGDVLTASLSTTLSKSSTDKKGSSEADVQVTPDLLKGQQELSQQTHEETAKQILFSYLKDGSNDSDETTKRKVNLVFEKIQTLKSRATAGSQSDNKAVDFAAQVKTLQERNAEMEKKMSELKIQIQRNGADRKSVTGLKTLQEELEQSTQECKRLREKLAKTETELQNTVEELFQVKIEREQYQTEIRDLQDQLSEMHDELDTAKKSVSDGEKTSMMADMMHLKLELQEILLAKEEQEDVLKRRERELTALKGALKEEVAAHDHEVDKMKEQYEKEMSRLQMSLEEAKQSSAAVIRQKAEVEAAKGAVEGQAGRLSLETERLRRRAQELENEVAKLNRIIDEAKLQESRLGDRVGRLEKEKRQLEESLAEIREQEEEMSRANRALTIRLEDVQRNLNRLTLTHNELEEMLQEERSQKEQFKNMKNNIEEERRLLDRTVEKLQREMNDIVDASQSSTLELQEQIDLYKEKNRRELTELQKLLKERGLELEKHLLTSKTLQEELSQREEELQRCQRERDEATLREKALEKKLQDLEGEAETKANAKEDRARQVKLMEDRITQLELNLEEERQSGDHLMDRIDRGREQNKDLKGRLSHLEGSQKSNKENLVAQLEGRIQELEERLEGEERERANLQLANRRLERKVKEMVMQGEEEHNSLLDQKDQLNLRLKALKRQMDEAEEEIDRLEHAKKKLQRELDEQQEANEQLQNQLKALRRKSSSAPLLNTLHDDDDDDDDISTDGETYFSSSSACKRSSSQENLLSTFSL
ncbi:cingulin-like protein 1 isoform X2 [Takifugu flavidus]|uniref:cingulin-like protein 1 isoform X2 n=1 Tax=Takifugu flavidus TaxID=433684 RepID=UPI0025444DE0|nr:cingulin-like protein 1 isoform X2 [Takifugu flavidus]